MSEVLHAWVCGELIGRFERASGAFQRSRFVYSSASDARLSISLPYGEAVSPEAADNFLEALLPESGAARDAIQASTGARSTSSWDLLTAIGGDLPGGIVLHSDLVGPVQGQPFLYAATEDEIADRIAQIRRGGTGFARSGVPPRFSLAGAQSKFALTRTSFGDFWSDAWTPSTHILKPESRGHSGLEQIEFATLRLANLSGVAAPRSAQVEFAGETTFQITRFDRFAESEELARRIHAEDMTQALGVSPDQKYLVGPDEITAMLRRETGDDELGYEFYRQYAFNAIIGNADAHGKNYSLLHEEGSITLSPLYDAIPIGLFPEYGQSLAMPVGYMDHFLTITPDDWTESAVDAGLDPERVRLIVQEVADGVREHLETTVGAVRHSRVSRRALDEILESADRQTGDIPAKGA